MSSPCESSSSLRRTASVTIRLQLLDVRWLRLARERERVSRPGTTETGVYFSDATRELRRSILAM